MRSLQSEADQIAQSRQLPIRVLLADDHHLVRAGLHALISGLPDFEVVAQASDGLEAMLLIESVKPQIAVVDIEMPGKNGIDVLREVRVRFPQTRIILLSMHIGHEYVTEAIRLCAAGYLLKDSALTELVGALRAVAGGDTYLTARVAATLAASFTAANQPPIAPDLSPRQIEVLRLVALGHSTKEIARELTLSTKTVETHRAQIMGRLDIHDVAGLVRYAIRKGIASLDD
jgi:DNA-binding NarL/FixJ family response regulator